MNRVLSEVARELEHPFLTYQKLEYTAGQNPDLGRFILSYFLDNKNITRNKKLEKKERETARKLMERELKKMNILILGNITCDYSHLFGNTDKLPDLYFLNKFTDSFSQTPIGTKLGEYDLIITENYPAFIPSGIALERAIRISSEDAFKINSQEKRLEYDPAYWRSRELASDQARTQEEILKGIMFAMYIIKLAENNEGEKPDAEDYNKIKTKLNSIPELSTSLITNEDNLKDILFELEKCNSTNYGAQIIQKHLKPGGIMIDDRATVINKDYKISEPFGVLLMARKCLYSKENTYGDELVLLDKKYGIMKKTSDKSIAEQTKL